MSNFALLNNVEHQDIRVITERSADYGDNVMYAMTFPHEFRDVQAFYPILIHRDENEEFYPMALFGFRQGENLFLDESGWHARYVPAMIRRQPFLIGYQASKEASATEPARVLSLDMDNPRVNKEAGERLFQPLGGRTPYLEDIANLLEAIYQGYEQNKRFMGALKEHDLIESVTFDITLDDGSKNQLFGFYTIDEDRLRQLPGSTLEKFSQEGFLMAIFMMLASLTNVRTLIDLENRKLKA